MKHIKYWRLYDVHNILWWISVVYKELMNPELHKRLPYEREKQYDIPYKEITLHKLRWIYCIDKIILRLKLLKE